MHSTDLRREHIHGLLAGIAIGDALGYPRRGLTRRQAAKLFGAGPCKYGLSNTQGATGFNSAQVFATVQSIVSSGTELEKFGHSLLRRLGWYSISFPTDMPSASRKTGLLSWLRPLRASRPSNSDSSDPLVRSMMIVLALHNTNLGTRNWIEHSVRLTHDNRTVIEGCHHLAGLTNLIIANRNELNSVAIAKFLSDRTAEFERTSEYREYFAEMVRFIENGARPSEVAEHFGWSTGIPGQIAPTVVMSIYCYLRHIYDYRKAVESVIHLGGDTSTTGAIVGGLSGATLGIKKLPSDLYKQLSNKAYGPSWIEEASERLAQWPHGVDDLHDAPALAANPIGIVRANLARRIRNFTMGLRRVPCKLFTSSPARVRHRAATR